MKSNDGGSATRSAHILGMAGAYSSKHVLDDAVARIVSDVHPWRIVLFGSRARATDHSESDYDLYIEVERDGKTLDKRRDRIRDLVSDWGSALDLKVHHRGEIERRRDDPGTIEWDVAREGRVLYAAPDAPITIAPVLRVREAPRAPPKSVHERLDAARRDIEAAELCRTREARLAPTICWLSQQMCEKYLKALLVSRWLKPKRTHDLNVLLNDLRQAGCPLPGLDRDCKRLTEYAEKARYAGANRHTVRHARAASKAATRIIAAVRAELPPSLH